MRVYNTTDYDQFKTLKGNRYIDPNNYKKLLKAIEQKNLLEINPIIVNEKFEVIDGQHRLEIAKTLNLPVYYYVASKTSYDEVITLNNVSKRWNLFDFANLYAKLGNKYYKFLVDLNQEYQIPISNLLGVLNGMIGIRNSSSGLSYLKIKEFKEGLIEISYEKRVELKEFCSRIELLSSYFSFAKNRSFIQAFQSIERNKDFNFKKFISRLNAGAKITKKADVNEYKRAIEEAYNYNINHNNRLRLF